MNDSKRKKRIYWFEGVTRAEVERSLHDTRPSVLRRQGPRRALVATLALALAVLMFTVFITQDKVKTYSEIIMMVTVLALFFQLRKSVRLVADAPDELLDERQIAVRDAGYTVAYRTLAIVSVMYVALVIAVAPGGVLHPHVADSYWVGIAWSYLMCCASLPAMVIAWRMPSEPLDEAG